MTAEKKQARLENSLGYSAKDLAKLPEDAVENAFGCGNPLSFSGVKEGDVVLDIGSGAGIDCFLAAEKVGKTGRVIGLDMTPAMIERARTNAKKAGITNVSFLMGDAEAMPVEDASVDWIISNCVINLAPDKKKVFKEVFRVLKPGGHASISDIVLGNELPKEILQSIDALVGCVAGAIKESDYLQAMQQAGLTDVAVISRSVYGKEQLRGFLDDWESQGTLDPEVRTFFEKFADQVVGKIWSARIVARKPALL